MPNCGSANAVGTGHVERRVSPQIQPGNVQPPKTNGLHGALVALGDVPLTPDGVFQAVGVAYMVSQSIHRGLDAVTAPESDISLKGKTEKL